MTPEVNKIGQRVRQRGGKQRGERSTRQREEVGTATGHTFGRAGLGQSWVMARGGGRWQLGSIECTGHPFGRRRRHGAIDVHVELQSS